MTDDVAEARELIIPMLAVVEFIVLVTPDMPPRRRAKMDELIARANGFLERTA